MADENINNLPTPHAEITMPALEPPGFILDLCCGGEGVVARAYPGRVVGVDRLASEIKECRGKCPLDTIFLVGDATCTQFIDNTFPHVTVFFGLMYVKGAEARRALFREAARVLRPGGLLHVWDAAIPAGAPLAAVEVWVKLASHEVIRAGYGVRGPLDELSLETVNDLAKDAGLRVREAEQHATWFYGAFESPVTTY